MTIDLSGLGSAMYYSTAARKQQMDMDRQQENIISDHQQNQIRSQQMQQELRRKEISGKRMNELVDAKTAKDYFSNGDKLNSLSFEFARLGDDEGASKFGILAKKNTDSGKEIQTAQQAEQKATREHEGMIAENGGRDFYSMAIKEGIDLSNPLAVQAYQKKKINEARTVNEIENAQTRIDEAGKYRQALMDRELQREKARKLRISDTAKLKEGSMSLGTSDSYPDKIIRIDKKGNTEIQNEDGWEKIKTPADFQKLGAAVKPPTVSELKASMNYTSMDNAEKIIEKYPTENMAFLATIQHDSNGYLSSMDASGRRNSLTDEQQVIAQAMKQFAEGAGHLKSGARINKQTMDIITDIYIPIPGDSQAVRDRKKAARLNDIAAARIGGGRAVKQLLKEESKGRAPVPSGNAEQDAAKYLESIGYK